MTEGTDRPDHQSSLIRLFPGFPLPEADYQELVTHLEADGGLNEVILVAHSLGALDALVLDTYPESPLFLLAPSLPRRRRGTFFLKLALRAAGNIPVVRGVLARRFRDATYRRYGADAPSGPPLTLTAAAQRLGPKPSTTAHASSRPVVLLISSDDPRHANQVLLAAQLGARIVYQPGGHLFPITHATSTAQSIRAALASD